MTHKDMNDRISNLTIQLLNEHPFFGTFLVNTNIHPDKSIPTAATNGITILFNPSFFEQLTDIQVKGVLIHETLHCCYFHCDKKRRGIRDVKKFNSAADYVINLEIDEMDKKDIELPMNITVNGKPFSCLLDAKYKNMYVEQVYDLLPDNFTGDSFDIHLDMPSDEASQQDIEDKIIVAYEISKRQSGKMSAGITRMIEEIRKSRVPWSRVFQRYMMGALTGKDNYSYSQPNRRFIGEDLYMPSLLSYKLGTVAVAIDTSGSIGAPELGAMTNELRKISALISEVIVMSCDSDVHSFEIITNMANFEKAVKAIKGNGGTDFRPPFELLAKKRIVPEIFIYFTDLYGTFPEKKLIRYPVIWVSTTEQIAPKELGVTIQMKL